MKAEALYERVTNELIAAIEAGAGEWEMPWQRLASTKAPTSLSTGKPYKGVNWWILALTQLDKGYSSNIWGTYKGWGEQGDDVSVRKGEKAEWAILWKQADPSAKRRAENPDAKPFLLARAFPVFNRDQVDGLPPLEPTVPLSEHERHDAAEAYFAAIGADVREGGDRAYYAPVKDCIAIPAIQQFPNRDHYYTTLGHEHTHWTGHESRLKRDISNRFGDQAYAAEELIAELGAAFFGAQMGLDPAVRKDHSSYLAAWLKILKADSKAIVTAASQAQKALDFLNTAACWQPDKALEAV
jgi:antirestriction protein ArdC